MAAELTPYFCSDCDSELRAGRAVRKADGRVICDDCERKIQRKKQERAQGDLFTEQRGLFNPARRGNVGGFVDANGQFHPIRASKDYNEFLAGDFDTDRHRSQREFRKQSKRRESHRAEEAYHKERGETFRDDLPKRSVAQFVRSVGGITPGGALAGEVKRLGFKETGTTGLINQKARQGDQKQTAEYVMDAANEEGYRDRHGRPYSNISEFLMDVETSAVKGKSRTRAPRLTKAKRDAKVMAKARQNPKAQGKSLARVIDSYRAEGRSDAFIVKALIERYGYAKQDAERIVKNRPRKVNPSMFGPEAIAGAKRVVKRREIKDRISGIRGRIVKRLPGGFLKVQWEDSNTPSLIARSEITLDRGKRLTNPLGLRRCTSCNSAYYESTECPMCLAGIGAKRNPTTKLSEHRAKLIARANRLYDQANKTQHFDMRMATSAEASKLAKRVLSSGDHSLGPVGKLPNAAKGTRDAFGVWHANPAKAPSGSSEKHWLVSGFVVRPGDPYDKWAGIHILAPNKMKALVAGRPLLRDKYGSVRSLDVAGPFHDHDSAMQAFKAERKSVARHRAKRSNPSVTDVSKMFQGRASGSVSEYKAADSAPANLARIGKLVFLDVEGLRGTLKFPGAMVAADTKGKLWIVGKSAPMASAKAKAGQMLDYGPIKRICYDTAKAHIGEGKRFEYVHEFGEEGGKRPHLLIDSEGMPVLRGGDYKIKAEGIVN